MDKPLRVLVVEDIEEHAYLLVRELRVGGYQVTHARVDSEAAMRSALATEAWDLIISDYSMPDFSVQGALQVYKESELPIPFLVASAVFGEEAAVEVMRLGAHDYLLKNNLARLVPAVARELAEADLRREGRRLEEKLQRSMEATRMALEGTFRAIALVVSLKDPYVGRHQVRVSLLAGAIATETGISVERRSDLVLAASVHDIGVLAVPADVALMRRHDDPDRIKLYKDHPRVGYDALRGAGLPAPVAEIVLQHHELMDGSGYPAGLKGEQIAFEARILSVSNIIEQSSADTPWYPAPGVESGLEEIARRRGILYDAGVVDACLRLFREKGFVFEDQSQGRERVS